MNTSLGWIEVPHQMVKINEEKGDLAGFFWGSLRGLTYCLGRSLLGTYGMSIFLFPPYRTLVKPDFIFSEEKEE